MLIRIVKMNFKTEEIDAFRRMFDGKKTKIRNFQGCRHLELYQDKHDPEIFFTYSFWESDEDLQRYRHSELFKSTWQETKAKFAARAEAWSVNRLDYLE